ncbi:MAG: mechanosensitive ion channel family protein [Candidatus Omnitrophica bacterium]|nr:mechanosensitive ion channel family protein [Candidatus Omnitrophota bacterium]MDD5654191.1 mechanosensitive ion channel family protein [Candidatus Omnitrophota bacterium]
MNPEILERVFFGNRILDYSIALLILAFSLLFVKIVIRFFIRRLKKLAERTVATFDDFLINILEKIGLPALYISCFYVSVKTLKLPSGAGALINALEMIIITFFAARIVVMLAGWGINIYLAKKQQDPTVTRSLDGLLWAIKFLIWALAAIILLDNLGYKVSTLIAGLGIGGIAVAIAAQALLKDFFSYFSIVFDRPFKIGDFIIIGDFMGSVEYIGIKTTRIRSLGGEQVVFSNTDLTDSRVRNYRLMEKRRVLFRIGATYQTSLSHLKEIPKIIEKIIKNTEGTAFDRAHFFSYGDFSLIFEVVYFVLSSDYNKYMDIQQEINFAIKEEFEKRGIDFAYPTQKLYISKE